MGPRARSPLNAATRALVIAGLVAFVVWLVVWPLLTADGGPAVLLGLVGFFVVMVLVIDLAQRRQGRHVRALRDQHPVAFAMRTPAIWDVSWLTSDASVITMWELRRKVLVPVVEVDRAAVAFEPAVLPVSNFHQAPGLRMTIEGRPSMELWLLHDVNGLLRRRLEGPARDAAVQRLLAGR